MLVFAHWYLVLPLTTALVYRAHARKSLTPGGFVAAIVTALVQGAHPWGTPFYLLCVFFLAGTRVTKINHQVKAQLTLGATGTAGGEGPRTWKQVFANSGMASLLSLLHTIQLVQRVDKRGDSTAGAGISSCFSWIGNLLFVGIVANYAAVTADTFSSELGILSTETPRLITSPTLRKVPRGTNGGVTLVGIGAGLLGSAVIAAAAVTLTPLCSTVEADLFDISVNTRAWTIAERFSLFVSVALWGLVGSVVDSLLGGWFQYTVKDVRSGKVVEGDGGERVLVSPAAVDKVGDAVESKFRAGIKSSLLHGEADSAVDHTDATLDSDNELAASGAETRTRGGAGHTLRYDPIDKHRKPSFGDQRPSRMAEAGRDYLDNNDVNFLMAFIMSVGAMAAASWYWSIPLSSAMSDISWIR